VNNILKAKAALILDQPFFATILLGMTVKEDPSVKTFAVDGTHVFYNPEFAATLTLNETVFVLAHETLHCVFQHMHRRGTRNANRWNQAADYVINDILVRENVGSMPQGGLHDSALVAQGNGTTEGVYGVLPAESESNGPGETGGSLDDCKDADTDPAKLAEKESEMKVRVIQAEGAARAAGKMPASLSRLVKDMTKTRTDWRATLRRFMTERTRTDYSYAKPKRRFLAEDIILPGLAGEQLGEIIVAVDCSGSCWSILETFSKELAGIVEDTKPARVRVLYFDTEVSHVDTFERDDTVSLEGHGGGGTDFAPIFEHIESEGWNPAACVVLTDLEGPFGSRVPSYPVLWASICPGSAPFGEVMEVRE
jgi:predicted metal-dependent peptidase